MAKQIVMTESGLEKLKEELDFLKSVKRKEAAENVGIARSFGDLSENSEYDEAKNEQAKVEAQIAELEETIKHVTVISDSEIQTDSVRPGVTVGVLSSRKTSRKRHSAPSAATSSTKTASPHSKAARYLTLTD